MTSDGIKPVDNDYTGIENLEAMEAAINYRRYLAGLLQDVRLPQTTGPLVALDFGAGVGTYAREARAVGYRVLCVEPDPKLLQMLRGDGFDCYSSSRDVLRGSCDLAYSYNVLEHIPDDEAALRDLYRLVRPGGVLLLYVPAFQVLFGPMDSLVGHLRRYRRRGLETKVRAAGFKVQASCYADSLGFFVALGYRLSGRRSGRITSRSVAIYDRYCFPFSRFVDRLFSRLVGKNAVLIAIREDP